MKLITECSEPLKVKILNESADGSTKKEYYIEGVFLQCDLENRNGRVYPLQIVKPEFERYIREYVQQNRALGELGHPDGPTLNLDRVSHKIVDLYQEGTNYLGKAKILNTPLGCIVKAMIDDNVKLAVSSRGVGTVENRNGVDYVMQDYRLVTAGDVVADPSAPEAFVNGIMEGKEWVWNSGMLEPRIMEYKKIAEKMVRDKQARKQAKLFEAFLQELQGKVRI